MVPGSVDGSLPMQFVLHTRNPCILHLRVNRTIPATLPAAEPHAAPTFPRAHRQISRRNSNRQRNAKRPPAHQAPPRKYQEDLKPNRCIGGTKGERQRNTNATTKGDQQYAHHHRPDGTTHNKCATNFAVTKSYCKTYPQRHAARTLTGNTEQHTGRCTKDKQTPNPHPCNPCVPSDTSCGNINKYLKIYNPN